MDELERKANQAMARIRRYKNGERAEEVWKTPDGKLGSRADYHADCELVTDWAMASKQIADEATDTRKEAETE
jgi:hypothetical protein